MNNQIKNSFIIISRNNDDYKSSLESIFHQRNIKNIEIIICQGNNPSFQRNKAAEVAKGENLIFLDNDSILSSNYLNRLNEDLEKYSDLIVLGGVSEIVTDGSLFQDSIKILFGSFLGIGPFRSRYNSYGQIRKSTEQELIMCNLLIRRSIYLKEGGLNEAPFPNEENELLDHISELGPIYHDPLLIVSRPPRKDIIKFINQMFRYGRGRGEQFMLRKQVKQLIYFLPMFFFFSLPIAMNEWDYLNLKNLIYFYFFIYSFCCLHLCLKYKKIKLYPFLFLNLSVCHFFYGIGQAFGILYSYRVKKQKSKITLQTINL